MLKNGVFTQNLKLIILFGIVLSHRLAKSFSVPFLVESMMLSGNACIATSRNISSQTSACLKHASLQGSVSHKIAFIIWFFFLIFVEELWYNLQNDDIRFEMTTLLYSVENGTR